MTFSDVEAARDRIRAHAHRTPVLTSATIDRLTGARVFFKCENFQRVGAFKFRGACNAVFALGEAEARAGVATHSSGNHAQAVALTARLRGVPAFVVMPRTAPEVKRAAVAGYGARITLCEPTLEAREAALREVVAETGAVPIHPYNDPWVIAGQGTAALELLEECGRLDAVVAPVGGGGLLAGTALAAKGVDPSIRVVGAEPKGADDAFRSLRDGVIHPSVAPRSVADGLLASLGSRTFPILREHVERIVTVEEDEILGAMRLVWERMKIVIEPSSAVAVAAVLAGGFGGGRVGVILTGGNVELASKRS